ncbi:hypothetical protein, partial [Megamonas funiformis]|uniref:hypothetical protein n=1 Tax=Megamonas funiformis TaxID=437897 RepID=UPI0039916640
SLNPKMLGSIHFKLIREAFFAFYFGEFVFLHFFFCAVFKDQYLREIFSQNQTMLECARHMPLPR